MEGLTVGGSVLMRTENHRAKASFKNVVLIFARIGRNLDLRGAQFWGKRGKRFDLSRSRIGGELRLAGEGYPSPAWDGLVRMNLRNARVGAIQDSKELGTWPKDLELEGFVYDRLGGFGVDASDLPRERPVTWYEGWLGRDPSFAPQPYEQLAKVLRQAGEAGKADDILFAGWEEQREDAWHAGRVYEYLWLTAKKSLIGYGYRVHWAAGWTAFLWLLGFLVLGLSGENVRKGIYWGFSYSLDMLLPVIELRKFHYTFDLDGWARYYFYAHKLAGYVLIGFLIAGLSGLTR